MFLYSNDKCQAENTKSSKHFHTLRYVSSLSINVCALVEHNKICIISAMEMFLDFGCHYGAFFITLQVKL